MVVDPDLKHAMQTQVYGLGSYDNIPPIYYSSFHFLFHHPIYPKITPMGTYIPEVVLSPVQGVFLCTLRVRTPGFGPLNHETWPLIRVFGYKLKGPAVASQASETETTTLCTLLPSRELPPCSLLSELCILAQLTTHMYK